MTAPLLDPDTQHPLMVVGAVLTETPAVAARDCYYIWGSCPETIDGGHMCENPTPCPGHVCSACGASG